MSSQAVTQDLPWPSALAHSLRRPTAAVVTSLVGVLLVAIVDYATGREILVTLFYLAPVSWSAWFAGRRAGWFIAAASALAGLAAIGMESGLADQPWVLTWNTLTLGGSFAVVAWLLTTLKHTQENLEATVARRTAKLRAEMAERLRAEDLLRQSNIQLQRTQQQLIESAKLESVGRMAAGVAHEVKNPLMTLGMAADYFLRRTTDNEGETLLLQDMKEAVVRATHIINLMLDFSRPRPPKLAPEDLNEIVESSLSLVRHQLLKQQIEVVRQLQPALPVLSLDRTRMQHALVNLFTNAAQAMPEGSTLTVRSSLQETTDDDPGAGTRVLLEVEDSGPGIPPERLPNLFEPFYTTKPPGQGTGLGLAIVRSIMRIHDATVTLLNRPEGGARATLTFNPPPQPPS